jgi:hypothetical protein
MRRQLVVLAALVSGTACNALTGVDDLGTGPGRSGGGAVPGDGGASDGRASDGGGGAGEGGGGTSVRPSLAACGDESLCVTSSNGWTPAVHVLFGLGPSTCPAAWPNRTDYKQSGGGSCECKCSPVGVSCAGPLQARTGNACQGPVSTLGGVPDGTCTSNFAALASPLSLQGTGETPSSCRGDVEPSLAGPVDAVTCAGAAATPSASCEPGEVCVPKPPKSLGLTTSVLCMAHEGDVACPSNLPFRILGGSAVTDGRSCAASCTCEPTDCKGGKLDAFTGDDCTGLVRSYQINGVCATAAAPANVKAVRYTAPAGCKVDKSPQVLGTVTVQVPRTFCCVTPSPF